MSKPLYVGVPWQLEVKATDTKTGLPVEPASLTVVVYPPAARTTPPTRSPLEAQTLPKIEDNIYEAVVVPELDEMGQWLAVVTSPAPFKAIAPIPEWVFPVPVMPEGV